MIPIISPYKMTSESATALAAALHTKKVYPDRRYYPRNNHLLINWGSSSPPVFLDRGWPGEVLNRWCSVRSAGNKLLTFQRLKEAGVSTPEFTTNHDEAHDWLRSGIAVVERNTLTTHSGQGIIIRNGNSAQISPDCRLITKYVKKSAEYRVHVFKGRVIDVQQKRTRRDTFIDYQVRSYNNGWVFCREDCSPDNSVLEESIAAVQALGLDFGAVDVIWNSHYEKAYVLEVNTAPGIVGTTLNSYVAAIQELL